MVDWLLGDERNKAFREQQLTATASGNFFRVFVDLSLDLSVRSFCFLSSVVDHVITENFLLHLLAVPINGILLKFF